MVRAMRSKAMATQKNTGTPMSKTIPLAQETLMAITIPLAVATHSSLTMVMGRVQGAEVARPDTVKAVATVESHGARTLQDTNLPALASRHPRHGPNPTSDLTPTAPEHGAAVTEAALEAPPGSPQPPAHIILVTLLCYVDMWTKLQMVHLKLKDWMASVKDGVTSL